MDVLMEREVAVIARLQAVEGASARRLCGLALGGPHLQGCLGASLTSLVGRQVLDT